MSRSSLFIVASLTALATTGCPLSDDYHIVSDIPGSAGTTASGGSGGTVSQAGQSGSPTTGGNAGSNQGGSLTAGTGGTAGDAGTGGLAGETSVGGAAGDAAGGSGGDSAGNAGTSGAGVGGTTAGSAGSGGTPYCLDGWELDAACGGVACMAETQADRKKCQDILNCYEANRCGPLTCANDGQACDPKEFSAGMQPVNIARDVFACRCAPN